LQDLSSPDAKRIKQLERLAESEESLKAMVGNEDDGNTMLSNVFWICATLLSNKKIQSGTKRVFLFTDDDEPHNTSIAQQRAAKIRARDFGDLGISIELFSIVSAGKRTFNKELFWADILRLNNNLSEDDEDLGEESYLVSVEASIEKMEELLQRVRRRESKKRSLARLPFQLGEGMEPLAVKLYARLQETKKNNFVWMDSESGRVVVPRTEWLSSRTGAVLNEAETVEEENGSCKPTMRHYYDFGGEKVILDAEDIGRLKDYGPPGLQLLGFKPKELAIAPYYNLTYASFVYPDEMATRGSMTLFSSLLDEMQRSNTVAMCRYIPRVRATPRLVALVPQPEERDDNEVQLKPPGMHLVQLPFADDLREAQPLPDVQSIEIDTVMLQMIEKLTLTAGFDVDWYENPALQKHYAALQALALEQDEPDQVEDRTMPNYAAIQKRTGSLLAKLNELFMVEKPRLETPVKTRKRTAPEGDTDVVLIIEEASKQVDGLSGLTVAILKSYLQAVGVKPKRLKDELVLQVQDYLKSKG